MIDRSQFVRFATPNPRVPEMDVKVQKDGVEETYRAPKGFRLDQFVAARNPLCNIHVTHPVVEGQARPDILVEARDPKTGKTIESHRGRYDA